MKNLIIILFFNFSLAQNTSVIEANYFKNNNLEAPIEVGKGFNVTDIYKQTDRCFTNESSNTNKLSASKTTNKTSSIKYYYTKTDTEFNNLIKNNFSGKIGFLSIFSLNTNNINNIEKNYTEENERIILKANVDFGVFSFANKPMLTNEAKAYITNNSFNEFIDHYGTHYVSGVRRENSIIVILTKTETDRTNSQENSASLDTDLKTPYKITGGFELANGSYINNKLKNTDYSVEIEVNGPSIDDLGLQNLITNIISGNSTNKINDINTLLQNSLKVLSNSKDSYFSQYYYTPFSLIGVKGINWTNEKINKLEQFNKNILEIYEAKAFLESISNDKSLIIDEIIIDEDYAPYEKSFIEQYKKSLPYLNQLLEKSENFLELLKQAYNSCNNINCSDLNLCCNTNSLFMEVKKYDFNTKIEDYFEPYNKMIEQIDLNIENSKPECEKKNISTLEIVNKSINPYNIFYNSKLIYTIPGNSTKVFEVAIGNHAFKCEQKSGFALYPTINNRTVKIENSCETKTVEIGF